MPKVELVVGGVKYGGWKSVSITRSIEQISGSFDLGISEHWPDSGGPRPIKPGQKCEVRIDGKPVITGHVDDVEPSYDATSREVAVRGRDVTGDLVDCSAVLKQWKQATTLYIAKALCAPFGIEASGDITGGRWKIFKTTPGETAFEALERAARLDGVLLISDGKGGLVITRAGTQRIDTALEHGVNIVSASATLSHRDRHSEITVKGQGPGDDDASGPAVAAQEGKATDAGITRHRPLIVNADGQGGAANLKQRAEWEIAVRLARSAIVEITVQGWSHAGGLWEPNTRVKVRDPWLGIDGEMLLTGVTLTLDESGHRAVLSLTRPQAFDLLPVPEPKAEDSYDAS